ncbi:TetR family transcriptional regulator [Streptomyces sp. 3MP-14]|uniref:TetR family transcriptional regulator n=1 Tax=Streptomyces mimosae TaxID=2586635 RepID=A0A5N6ALN6_9ACTN|nr:MULTISPECIES: TetR/AcrR family transcriptional regulator [Streptomyces]KAB8168820.1 TetR family transcriptional regulator [Streptomyces mimosae]KAB8177900.1 TetR family transcriptional regulator [Streptomyces sp. 3MP-14]
MPTDSSEVDPLELTPGAQRILEVASELFYRRGIHAVGVDTIAAESGVTKRTLYNRFGSKDNLLRIYLETRDRRWRELIADRLAKEDKEEGDPLRRVLTPFAVLPEWLTESDRGCSFVNAFAELPERDHPGNQVIRTEKKWLREFFHDRIVEAGIAEPTARTLSVQLLALHEGAIVSNAIAEEPGAARAVTEAASALVGAALPAR